MPEPVTKDREYREVYLPWAHGLLAGEAAASLIAQAQADKEAVLGSVALFRPSLERVAGELTLARYEPWKDEEEKVDIAATFKEAELEEIAIGSLKNYLVLLRPRSTQWPVLYREEWVKKNIHIVTSEEARHRTERLVKRAGKALKKHMMHRLPVGLIPEESLEWSLDDGMIENRIKKALQEAGIETYGDLGILSVNQILKIPDLGKRALEEIKRDLANHGWLSPSFK